MVSLEAHLEALLLGFSVLFVIFRAFRELVQVKIDYLNLYFLNFQFLILNS